MKRIVTSNPCPPIPWRQFDWSAHYDGCEEDGQYGYGATEAKAIENLKELWPEDEELVKKN